MDMQKKDSNPKYQLALIRISELEQENTRLRIENADLKKSVIILKEACEHVV